MTATEPATAPAAAWPSRGQRTPPPRRVGVPLLLAAAGAAAGALLFLITRNALPDDSYITFSYARNLAHHGEWALAHGIPSNTATSPLNVWLLAGLTLVTTSPVIGAGVLLAASLAATAVWLHGIARAASVHSVAVPLIGVALLVASPLLNSTVGLESYLATALGVGLARYALFGRWTLAGVATGLLVLARPDMATVAVVVLAVAAAYRRQALRPLGALGLGASIAVPWSIFLWVRFGSATSDTLPAKSVAGGWDGFTLLNGLGHYLQRWTLPTLLALVPMIVGAAALIAAVVALVLTTEARRNPAVAVTVAFGLGGVADYAAMSAMGVVPFFWYYAPLVAGLSFAAVFAAAGLQHALRPVGVAALAAVAATAALAGAYDLGRGAPWNGMAPIRINWATPAQYAAIGKDLPAGAVVESPGEIGTIAYFCDCTVVDYLADPGRMTPYIAKYRAEHPGSALLALNYYHYRPPAPVVAQWRIVYEPVPPTGAGDWPTSFPHDVTKRMRLERI